MARIRVGDAEEAVVTRGEWPLEKARKSLEGETIAVLGYGVQGPGQALNLRDNGFRVIVGQRRGSASWDRAVADGWVEGETLFDLEEAARQGTILQYLLSDAGQISRWEEVRAQLTPGKCLGFSHGFGVTYRGADGDYSARRCGRRAGGPQRVRPLAATAVREGQGRELELRHLPGRDGPREGEGHLAGNRRRLRFSLRDRLPEGGVVGSDGRARHPHGGDRGRLRGPVRGAPEERPFALGGVQTRRSRN